MARTEVATLAGGCFWCLEAVYVEVEGVQQVVSGYMGGHVSEPTYRAVCEGDTGHAEVVQVTFDPDVIGFRDLLDVFFAIHDPTTPNRQGNDVGTQYRSAIFFHTAEQQRIAIETIDAFTADAVFPAPIVTQVVAVDTFFPAEAYHRDYFARNPQQPYCQFVVGPKVAKLRKRFAHRLKRSA